MYNMAVEMKEFAEELRAIAEACLNDARILEIVSSVAGMNDEDRDSFKKKVLAYFMTKNSPEDMEAYNFYKVILTGLNAKFVLDLYESLCQTQE